MTFMLKEVQLNQMQFYCNLHPYIVSQAKSLWCIELKGFVSVQGEEACPFIGIGNSHVGASLSVIINPSTLLYLDILFTRRLTHISIDP